MRSQMVSILSIFCFISLGLNAWAEEKSQSAATEIGADREYAQLRTKLNVQEQKATDLNKRIQELILAKAEGRQVLDEKGNPMDTLKAMTEAQKNLRSVVDEYNSTRKELRFRYPEEGALIERRYVPLRAKTVEEIEHEMGLAGDLTRIKAKIDKKYEPITGPKATAIPQSQKGPESTLQPAQAEEVEKPKRLKLVN